NPNDAEAQGPCYGPLGYPEYNSGQAILVPPAISADGWKVAFLTSAAPRPIVNSRVYDMFVTDMHPGLSRKAGTVELTREDSGGDLPISSVGISEDGNVAAFTTVRGRFVLSSPALTEPPVLTPDHSELYAVSLDRMEMERVTRAYDG